MTAMRTRAHLVVLATLLAGCGGPQQPRQDSTEQRWKALLAKCKEEPSICKRRCDGGEQLACSVLTNETVAAKLKNPSQPAPGADPSCDTIGFDKERCCKAGHGEHCFAQAEALKGATPTDASAKRPQRLSYLRLGCDKAHAKSCLVLGEELIADKHEQEAVAPLQKACEAEEFKACLVLDDLGEPRSSDPKKAAVSVKKQCDGGDDAACLAYASVIAKADPKGAMVLREKACSSKTSKLSKDVKATCLANIARAYESGDGVTSDTFRAYAYFEEACLAGHLGSCLKTAAKCEGEREAHQITEVGSCYEPACKLGHADSCVLIAEEILKAKNPTDDDIEKAIQTMKAPCQAKDPRCKPIVEKAAKIQFDRATKAIPGMFTTCEQHKAQIGKWRAQGVEAGKKGDKVKAEEAFDRLKTLEPVWNANLDRLQKAIEITTTGDDDTRGKKMLEVQKRCSCGATPSGQCAK